MIKGREKKGKVWFFKLVTLTKSSLWKFYFKDDAVCYVSHALHGSVSEAEHFDCLKDTPPDN